MFERSEFLSARQTSAGRREPAQRVGDGVPFFVYFFPARKRSRASSGAQPPEFGWFKRGESGRTQEPPATDDYRTLLAFSFYVVYQSTHDEAPEKFRGFVISNNFKTA
jgi:hypothetical protein